MKKLFKPILCIQGGYVIDVLGLHEKGDEGMKKVAQEYYQAVPEHPFRKYFVKY